MGVFSNIQRSLDTHLNLLVNRPYVAWPNTKFTPVGDSSYIRPTLLPANSSLATLNDNHRNPGIYQVDIFVPLEKGLNSALTLADDIKAHFETSRQLTAGTDTVFIQNVSLGQLERQDAWFRVYIEINYICYSPQ